MEFCQNCGTRLKSSRNDAQILACSRCGYEKAEKEGKPSSTFTGQTFKEGIVVIDQDVAGLRVLPTVRADCLKCDAKKAHNWAIYVSDEDMAMIEVQVFRCTGCGYTWREKG
jgi:DNA-directed RNA polymerase subunit M/transcription elongation factor TFIIS